ncbi:hypothetical protein CLAFUW4_07714 [Fulvia fulva]|uniref:Transmembrane protein n=1 Tax=Passalora fulva TaxID=5499 RepID=A0A9Q8LC45_PASFU|nr:uncharacterized protein CLAFUR5_07842 [Fulvia fulva]KAK4629466.1 hypothetical protein CLAFUR4_07719 [Fulvia fulva]KAK4630736.1 hypothetical protein CLAFUR0_07717 [Fulvia fulva]UJO14651.1 hypothetical protein CLAFUR5_07842 [Fulvia fulva]WPV12972.1 hypothetical protein CLAFUW4_07714 [Fulvia fulva]WPV27801.1 hypothetical protein CLAFUW7_07715 [Fulvia fulva]
MECNAQDDSHMMDEGPHFDLNEEGEIVLVPPKKRERPRTEKRRRNKHLVALKGAGILPRDANHQDLQEWQARIGNDTTAAVHAAVEEVRKTHARQYPSPMVRRSQRLQTDHTAEALADSFDDPQDPMYGYLQQRAEALQRERDSKPTFESMAARARAGPSRDQVRAYDEGKQEEAKLARAEMKMQRGACLVTSGVLVALAMVGAGAPAG